MTKAEFKAKQIELYEMEQKLHADTQKVLYDMLWSMEEEDLETLSALEIEISDSECIISINGNGCTCRDNYDPTEERIYSLEALSQEQQKQVIDNIIQYIWMM